MEHRRTPRETERKSGRRTRILIVVSVLVLLAGVAAGVGMNLIFAKPKPSPETGRAGQRKTAGEAAGGKPGNPAANKAPQFDISRAMSDVFALSEQIGVRPTGSGHEAAAATYIVQELAECGYQVEEQPFTTPEGLGTRNIIATRAGTLEGYRFVIGAHYDSSGAAKGAVDDASGVGVVMEEARVFAGRRLKPTVSFVFLGANVPGSSVAEDRLLGARHFMGMLGSLDRKDVAGMIAVDSVACGDYLVLRTQETGLQRLRDKMATFARESNLPVTTLKSTVDSDNIPFEDAQIPAVWVQWCNAGGQEPADDSYAVVMAGKIESAGNLIRSFLLDLTQDDLRELKY